MIRRRLAAQEGFAVATAIIVLLVGLLFTTAMITEAISTQATVRRDGGSKRAIQAARAGTDAAQWLMTATALSTGGGDPDTLCASSSAGAVTYSGVAADGWCPPVTRQLGARETVTYRVSAPYQSAPGEISRDIVATGSVPGANGASITRRVRDKLVSVGPPNVFDDYAVVSLNDLVLSNSAEIGTQQVGGNARSNGKIAMSNSATIWGSATPGPGKAVELSNSATVHGSTAPATDPIQLPTATPPALPADNGQIDTACAWHVSDPCSKSSWQGRKLSLSNNDKVTITGNTFVLCQLQLSNNTELDFQPEDPSQPVRIYIDKPSNCGGVTDSVLLSNGTELRTTSQWPLQVYIVGASNPTRVVLSNATAARWTVYAPQSDVWLSNNVSMTGGVAAHAIQFSNSAEVDTPPGGTGPLNLGIPPTYERGDFTECTSQPTGTSPGSGC